MAHCPYSSIMRQEAVWLRLAAGLSEQREQEWRAEVRQAAQHAQAQATAAVEALSPAHRLDPADIAWGEPDERLLLNQSLPSRGCLGAVLADSTCREALQWRLLLLSAVEQRVHFRS